MRRPLAGLIAGANMHCLAGTRSAMRSSQRFLAALRTLMRRQKKPAGRSQRVKWGSRPGTWAKNVILRSQPGGRAYKC